MNSFSKGLKYAIRKTTFSSRSAVLRVLIFGKKSKAPGRWVTSPKWPVMVLLTWLQRESVSSDPTRRSPMAVPHPCLSRHARSIGRSSSPPPVWNFLLTWIPGTVSSLTTSLLCLLCRGFSILLVLKLGGVPVFSPRFSPHYICICTCSFADLIQSHGFQ